MAWEDLPVDQRGLRPGHPVQGRTATRTSFARDRLLTTTNTVRQMIAQGSLDGYWRRTGSRTTFYVYTDDLEKYLRVYGPLRGKRRKRQGQDTTSLKGWLRSEITMTELTSTNEIISELRASLIALADRISALEDELRDTRASIARQINQPLSVESERRRRLELEDALAALEADEALVAKADALNQQAYRELRIAHSQLRASIARVRRPRTIADLPGISDDVEH